MGANGSSSGVVAGKQYLDDNGEDGTFVQGAISFEGEVILSGIETIAAGGTSTALDLTKSTHSIDADAGGDIFTIAAGTEGQIITVACLSATGVATITPVSFTGGTSVTMNAAGETAIFQYIGASWYVIGGNAYTVI